MLNPSTRQTFLDIAANDYAVPAGVDPSKFVLDSLPLLGESEGEFRERYVYGTLSRWVISDAVPPDGLRAFHEALLGDDALFAGIGEAGSDSVFLRAFAVLMLSPTLYVHRQHPYLPRAEVERTASALTRYLLEERDLRGYVSDKKWWAHGIAHAADAVGQIVQCSELDSERIIPLLAAVAQSMTSDVAVYAHEEDARMAVAVLRLLQRDRLSHDDVKAWLDLVVPGARYAGKLPNVHIRYVNARNFLRCLYFQARASDLAGGLVELISAAHDALPAR